MAIDNIVKRLLQVVNVGPLDNNAGYLSQKLKAGANVTLTQVDPNSDGNLALEIAASGGGGGGGYSDGDLYMTPDNRPAGVVAPGACYAFDIDNSPLNDTSGNGNTLAWDGNAIYTKEPEIRSGIFCADANVEAPADASFQSTGEQTIEILWRPNFVDGNNRIICSINGSGESGGENALFQVQHSFGNIGAFYEYGSGSNGLISFDIGTVLGKIQLWTVTRDAAGTEYNLYINGAWQSTAIAAQAPSGGSGADLRIGGSTGGETCLSPIYSVRITNEEFTAAQVLEAYNALKMPLTD